MGGVQNVVAPQGTAFTADHARIIKRYVEEVVLCFDSDDAGQNAAIRSLDHLLASGLAVRVAVVPAPHDPDSFIKQSGGPAFKQLIDAAKGFFEYYLNRLCATNEVTTDKGRIAVLRAMAEALNKTQNVVLIDKHAQETALRLGVSPDAVRAEFRKLSRIKPGAAEPEAEAASPDSPALEPPPTHEYWLLKLVLLHDELVEWAIAHVDPAWLLHSVARQIIAARLEAHKGQTWTSLPAFLDQCESQEQRNLTTEATTEERLIPNPSQQLSDVTLRLRNQFLDRQGAVLLQKMNQPETSDAERIELLRQQQELRSRKRQPLAPLN